jgi:mono/diheme cytochrome c family protein
MNRIERVGAAVAMAVTTAAFAVAILTGCGEKRGVTPPVTPTVEVRADDDTSFERGRVVFMQYCNTCHPNTGAGLGPHLYELPVTSGMIAFQVRHGLGMMPEFDEELISDKELDDLVYYLDEVEELKAADVRTARAAARATRPGSARRDH